MSTIGDKIRQLTDADAELDIDVRDTYFALRVATGLIGLALPLVLVGWGLSHGVEWSEMNSLSVFYWLSEPGHPNALLRSWFVGSLVAIGICMVVYRGYSNLENWLLNLAGLAAVIVALNPMPDPSGLYTPQYPVHCISAVIFFLLIAATVWFCARDTLAVAPSRTVRAWWSLAYRLLAAVMAAAPLAAWLLARGAHQTIWVEVAGIWAFAAYWLAKTFELSNVSMIEPRKGILPKVRRVKGELLVVR